MKGLQPSDDRRNYAYTELLILSILEVVDDKLVLGVPPIECVHFILVVGQGSPRQDEIAFDQPHPHIQTYHQNNGVISWEISDACQGKSGRIGQITGVVGAGPS